MKLCIVHKYIGLLDSAISLFFNHINHQLKSKKQNKTSITLVAIAALAAFGAQAQSAVTITGNLDFAGAKVTGTQLGSNGTTFSTTTGTSSTSAIKFAATEDLGGGMKVTAFYAFDPRTLANDAYAGTFASATSTKNVMTGLSRDEMYVAFASNVGTVKLGSPNSIGLETQSASSPLGTASGSGYAVASGTMMNSIVNTRYNRSIRLDSPTISGFTASALYAPGNDVVAVDAIAATQIPNARATTELGLAYANGPVSLKIASIKQDAQTNKTGWYSGAYANTAAPADNPASTSATVLGASYAIDNTTLYYGMNTGDRLAVTGAADGTAVKSKGNRVAVKQTVGQFDLIAQQTTQKAAAPTTAAVFTDPEAKAKVTGLTALYNLSKTSATYIAYEKYNTGLAAVAGTDGGIATLTGTRKVVSIGLRKSF